MSEPTAARRRWFRYSLKTFFVGVTLIACWLGYQVHVVQHRKAMLQQIKAAGGVVVIDFDENMTGGDAQYRSPWIDVIRTPACGYEMSAVRTCLGDRPVVSIRFEQNLTVADGHAVDAFPEAQVEAGP